jgi:DNA-binding SARP family transcriptional activator
VHVVAAWIQLHGRFAVQVGGQSVEHNLPGRRARLLVAYLAAHRLSAVDRASLIELLWYPAAPGQGAPASFTVLLSKTRAVLSPIEIRGRGSLQIMLPPNSLIDGAVAAAALHDTEAAASRKDWQRVWTQALTTLFVTQRQFLSDLEHPWVDERRRAARHDHDRAWPAMPRLACTLGPPSCPAPSAARAA